MTVNSKTECLVMKFSLRCNIFFARGSLDFSLTAKPFTLHRQKKQQLYIVLRLKITAITQAMGALEDLTIPRYNLYYFMILSLASSLERGQNSQTFAS